MTSIQLADLISLAARQSFSAARADIGRDEIIGYAILSHDTADSCGPVVATRNGMAKRNDIPAADFTFQPVEWDVFPSDSYFEPVNRAIGKLYDAGDDDVDDWHHHFRALIFDACVGALEQLVHEGFFGPAAQRNALFISFALSDSATTRTHAPGWIRRLNTEQVYEKFMDSHQKWFSK